MSNIETIPNAIERRKAKLGLLRRYLHLLVCEHDAEDVVAELADAFSDEGYAYAQRTGDYDRASKMLIIARYLEKLPDFIDNFDPTPE